MNVIFDGITKHNSKIVLPSSLIGVGANIDKEDKEGNEEKEQLRQTTENTSILTLLGYRKQC